jgi:hypothetical protein
MKTIIWLLTLAFAAVCVVCWIAASRMTLILDGYLHLPAFTTLVLYPHGWILLCPVPCLAYVVYSVRRQQLSRRKMFVFAGTVVLTSLFLVSAVGTACILPIFFPRCIETQSK